MDSCQIYVEHLHGHFQRKNDIKASLEKYVPEVLLKVTATVWYEVETQ
jgi:hypothetical protein